MIFLSRVPQEQMGGVCSRIESQRESALALRYVSTPNG
jgi:hypothetical protein